MRHVWSYRIMQAVFLVSLLLCLILRTEWIFVVFLVNLAVYGTMKGKYDTQLEVIEGIYGLMRAAQKITDSRQGRFAQVSPELFRVAGELKHSEKKFVYLLGRKRTSASGDFMEMAAAYITGAFLYRV